MWWVSNWSPTTCSANQRLQRTKTRLGWISCGFTPDSARQCLACVLRFLALINYRFSSALCPPSKFRFHPVIFPSWPIRRSSCRPSSRSRLRSAKPISPCRLSCNLGGRGGRRGRLRYDPPQAFEPTIFSPRTVQALLADVRRDLRRRLLLQRLSKRYPPPHFGG